MSSIYIHGTNGSGKTTLARALMICAGGPWVNAQVHECPVVLAGGPEPVVFIGKYAGATGGMDTVQPYAEGVKAAITRAKEFKNRVVMESLVTPGENTCLELDACVPGLVFFWLNTPVDRCIANTLARRAARGSTTEFDPENLRRKASSCSSWAQRLRTVGITVEEGDWSYVYNRSKQILGLTEPRTAVLLDEPAPSSILG